jgi:hypothetical protein
MRNASVVADFLIARRYRQLALLSVPISANRESNQKVSPFQRRSYTSSMRAASWVRAKSLTTR